MGNFELRLSVRTASRVNQSQPINSVNFVKISFVQRYTLHLQSQKNLFQQEKLRKGGLDMIVVKGFIRKGDRNGCTTWQWLC